MTIDQIKRIFPGIDKKTDDSEDPSVNLGLNEFGQGYVSGIRPQRDATVPSLFSGIDQLSLNFLDERVTTLWVQYDNKTTWNNANEFALKLSEGLKLPNLWTGYRGDNTSNLMTCNGFDIRAIAGPGHMTTLTIQDLAVPQIVKVREQEKIRKQQQAFKP